MGVSRLISRISPLTVNIDDLPVYHDVQFRVTENFLLAPGTTLGRFHRTRGAVLIHATVEPAPVGLDLTTAASMH